MKQIRLSSGVSVPVVDLHTPPKKNPPRKDLRKPRLVEDKDLDKVKPTQEDKDLH